jgi:hypothetical protein
MSRSRRGGLVIPRPNAAGRAEAPKPPSVVREVHTQIHLVGSSEPVVAEARPAARATPIHIPSSQPTMKLSALRLDPIGPPTSPAPSQPPPREAPRRSGIVPARGRAPSMPPAPPLPREARSHALAPTPWTRSVPPPPPRSAPAMGLDRALAQAQTFARPVAPPAPSPPVASRAPAPSAPPSSVAPPVTHAALTDDDLALFESPLARLWRRVRAFFARQP